MHVWPSRGGSCCIFPRATSGPVAQSTTKVSKIPFQPGNRTLSIMYIMQCELVRQVSTEQFATLLFACCLLRCSVRPSAVPPQCQFGVQHRNEMSATNCGVDLRETMFDAQHAQQHHRPDKRTSTWLIDGHSLHPGRHWTTFKGFGQRHAVRNTTPTRF